MKQIWIIVLVALCVIGFSSLGFSQEHKCPMMDPGKGVPQGEKIGLMMRGMGHGCGMMMGKSLVATPDGGVIVSCCNKLFKYDKNLVLQKEVEIKMGKCPMSEKMKIEDETKVAPK